MMLLVVVVMVMVMAVRFCLVGILFAFQLIVADSLYIFLTLGAFELLLSLIVVIALLQHVVRNVREYSTQALKPRIVEQLVVAL
jgi:hypothetical protein